MIVTSFTKLVGVSAPIQLAAMPGISTPDLVAAVDEAKDGLQLVVARMFTFLAPAEHVEEEVELSRRRVPAQFHCDIARRSSIPW